jgi:hypothetical protein
MDHRMTYVAALAALGLTIRTFDGDVLTLVYDNAADPGRSVILTKGARARNVFWAVGSSATFGTGCSFYGNILAHQSISMATGTVMTGRALARVGAVTMQRNTIVKPGR